MNRSLQLASLLALFAFTPTDDVLTWRVAKGTTLVHSFESGSTLELQSTSVKVDGGDPDPDATAQGRQVQGSACEFSDSIESVKDGRPAKIVRRFTKLASNFLKTVKPSKQQEQKYEPEEESELEGKSVVFERRGSEWYAKWIGEEQADDALLEGLQAEVDFCAFLPNKDVSTDDTWEVQASDFLNFLRPLGQLSFRTKGEDDAADDNRLNAQLDRSLEGKAKATYRGLREENGARVAVIAIAADLGRNATVEGDGGEAGAIEMKFELNYELKGEILWDVAGGFARTASLEGSVQELETVHRTIKTRQGDRKVEQVDNYSGKTNYKLTTERK